jgi:hypothetical protein
MERAAWERCDKHRKELEAQVRGLREGVGGEAVILIGRSLSDIDDGSGIVT